MHYVQTKVQSGKLTDQSAARTGEVGGVGGVGGVTIVSVAVSNGTYGVRQSSCATHGGEPTAAAGLVGVCDGADFNQLVRERQTRHADEGDGRPMVAHILLVQNDELLEMLLRVC